MSRRDRKRRENRLNKTISPAPRDVFTSLPNTFEQVRVLNPYHEIPKDKHPTTSRIDFGLSPVGHKPTRDDYVDSLRRLHIQRDLRRNSIDPTGVKYDYRREYVGKDERVLLPSDHPICIERETRREVLFAKNKAGKGGGQKPPKLPKIILKCHR